MLTKVCTKCKEKKEVELFPTANGRKDGLASWCKLCYANAAAEKYKNHAAERERKQRNFARTKEANRQKLWSYLQEHPCIDCGNFDPRVLEFDHRDDVSKTREVSIMTSWSWASIMEEIAKCDVRCANCHRIRTQVQFGQWRSKMNNGM